MLKELTGYADMPGVGRIMDEDIYKLIVQHSTEEDRQDPRKMVEMTLTAEMVLFENFKDKGVTKDSKWTFYGEDDSIWDILNGSGPFWINDYKKC